MKTLEDLGVKANHSQKEVGRVQSFKYGQGRSFAPE